MVLAFVLLGCAPPRPAWDREWPGDSRARAQAIEVDRRGVPALSVAEARKRFWEARRGRDAFMALVFASRLEAAGGSVTAAERRLLLPAADHVAVGRLAALRAELDVGTEAAAAVALRSARYLEHVGDAEGASRLLATIAPGTRLAKRAEAQRAAMAGATDARVVAVLLPLSGRHARIGRELKRGVELAASELRDAGGELRYLDTFGTEEGAVAAVERAVRELRAVALLGPVGDAESRAAAQRAAQLGVPIGLLAPGVEGAAPTAGVFRLWSSPRWEAEEAARLAIELGYESLAVLAPNDEHGRGQAEAFIATARGGGVRVVAEQYYDPTATELETDLKQLLQLDPRTNRRLREHLRRYGRKNGWKNFSPDVPFDLVYVPDAYDRAALVASYFPYFNVELRSSRIMDTVSLRRKHGGRLPSVVQLLGSSQWHHESLIPRGGKAVEGALIVDVFAGSDNEDFSSDLAAEFAERFRRANGRTPSPAAAQAYDATLLLLGARSRALTGADGAEPRPLVTRALRSARLEQGACGRAQVGPGGELIREGVLLRIVGGEFVGHAY